MLSKIRNGNFNSSEIVALTSEGKAKGTYGAPFYTFIKQTFQEQQMKRSLNIDDKGRATKWGSFLEKWAIEIGLLGLNYTYTPSLTAQHPKYDFWVGSRDAINNSTNAVVDLKCPYSLTSFCDFAELHRLWLVGKYSIKQILCDGIKLESGLTIKHKDGEKYFWQLASNCCIAGTNKAELIIFCPNEEQLVSIIQYATYGEHENLSDYYFIGNGQVNEFPYLPKDSNYTSELKFEFEFAKEDLDFLENRVNEAKVLLDSLSTIPTLTIHEPTYKVVEEVPGLFEQMGSSMNPINDINNLINETFLKS